MRSGNPIFSDKMIERRLVGSGVDSEKMTDAGAVNKTAILLLLVLAGAFFSWRLAYVDMSVLVGEEAGISLSQIKSVMPLMIGGLIGGLVFALITVFKAQWSMWTAPLYAICEGLFLGALSGFIETQYPGIVIQAVGLTFGVFLIMLAAYKFKFVEVTKKFKMGLFAATGGVGILYLVSIVLGFFGIQIPFIHEGGLFGIAFSTAVVIIAALNLILDFDMIERGNQEGWPKYMEWYSAFGLMVTLIWLYIEILRLLMKIRGRD